MPQGSYDTRQSLTANTSLSGPLLSRFDILLVLRDLKVPTWDENVANHVLSGTEASGSTGLVCFLVPAAAVSQPSLYYRTFRQQESCLWREAVVTFARIESCA